MNVNDIDFGGIARVVSLSEDGERMTLQFINGNIGTAPVPLRASISLDTVLQFPADESPALVLPDELAPPMTLVGVVRWRRDGVTLVEAGSSIERIPESDVEYAENNTVEFRRMSGVLRVVDERPMRFSVREADEDADAQRYKVSPDPSLSLDDFAGLATVKERANELIDIALKRRKDLKAIGGRPIKGVLFTGDPGTGKTFLARILASEAEATFYAISGPEIVSKWVGDSEDLLREVFKAAAQDERAVIFFDEVDSVAARRTDSSHQASDRLVAQLLTLMDGFVTDETDIVVIAATNRPEDIDVALRRPGRFDWEVHFPKPTARERVDILTSSAEKLTKADNLPYEHLAAQTTDWSPADLTAIWSEAAILALSDDREVVTAEDARAAFERVRDRRVRQPQAKES